MRINEIERLREEIEKLRKENEELKHELEKTRKEKEEIEKKYEEYKMRHPETVGVKHGKPYFIKPSKIISQTPKKPGARKGHKPCFRPMPKHIDKVQRIPIEVCPDCGGTNLSENVQEIRERTFEDIPICTPIAIKLEIERKYCRNCKKLVETTVTNVLPGARLSLRIMLIVVWLKIGLRMTEEAIPELLHKLFGLKISEGEVIHILAQVAKAFGPYYKQLSHHIRNAPARHIDETSWRINGENVWLWAFVTQGEALYKIASGRSHDVPLGILGEKHNGVDIHDRFSIYKTLASKTKNLQQDCWAHIINNAKELAGFYGTDGEYILKTLKETYKIAKGFNHKGTDEDITKLYMDMVDKLDKPYKSMHCHKFVVNLLGEKDNLFQFVKNPDVEPTNNRVERALRHSVIARKISGGSRSEKGLRIYETLKSVFHTLSLRGEDLLLNGPKILQTSHG